MTDREIYIQECKDRMRALYQEQFLLVGVRGAYAQNVRRANQLEIKALVEEIEIASSSLVGAILKEQK